MSVSVAAVPIANPWLPLLVAALAAMVLLLAGLAWRQQRLIKRLKRELAGEAVSTLDAPPVMVDAPQAVLPGLLPRARFDAAMDKAVQAVDRQRGALVLLLVHLERSQRAGAKPPAPVDEVQWQSAAKRLTEVLGGQPPVAVRHGVDELLLLHAGDLESACTLAGRLSEALGSSNAQAAAGAKRHALVCSVGLAAYPQHGTRSRLAEHAGHAARAVRRAGGGGYMVFAAHMAEDHEAQGRLLDDLRHAVERGQFELFYQPKVAAKTMRITGVEALLRWHHPGRGIISPAQFIPMAERAGLIGKIGDWVINDACRQGAAWREQGLDLPVAVNLSAYQMRQDDLADRVEIALRRHKLPPGGLTVEVTESVAMEDTRSVRRAFERLREVGVQVSVDDYGVGQAKLGSLRELLVNELKIDASLVREVTSRPEVRGIVDAMVRLAHALQLRVVAMGVETDDQRNRLVKLGCDELQGFLFARPMTAAAACNWALLDASQKGRGRSFRPSLFQDTDAAVDVAV
jgi:EAL domain-containing protein (putative c-di-GMP-specific phosphodiesterase class I)/GGDEF domain-containing protein